MPRIDRNSQIAHEQLLEKARRGKIDVYFVGDSITRRWGATDYPDFLANWKQNFYGWNAANFGWGADLTQNIIWRLENGELDGVNPKIIVILAGTNNVGRNAGDEAKVSDVTNGIKALVVRVDSPGGSVLASERIRQAELDAKAKKIPVVVSMGSVAASGGYWVSTPADFIYAEP